MIHRFTLEKYKGPASRHRCPGCNHARTFTLYIDTSTGENLHETVGKCDREDKCGYHLTPKQYFQDNNISFESPPRKLIEIKPTPPPSCIPLNLFKSSLCGYGRNHFVKFLIGRFGEEITSQLIARYFIGTSKHWPGATVFWQVAKGQPRAGKIMLYDAATCRRVKEPFNHVTWVHSVTKQPDFVLGKFLFGEHLLKDKSKPVAVVESEKTAIISSVYLPQFTWVAVGSDKSLKAERCHSLKGHSVTLFPDLGKFDAWTKKAVEELSHLATFRVSDLLERKATDDERKEGLDLADYLIKYDYKEFIKPGVQYHLAGRNYLKGYPVCCDIEQTPLERMASKYPMVKELITKLDLVPT